MRKYLKAELYRMALRITYRNTLFFFLLLSLAGSLVLKFVEIAPITNPYETSMTIMISGILTSAPFLLYGVLDMVMGEDLKHKTLNNTIAGGVPRLRMITTKILTTAFFGLLLAAVGTSFHLLSTGLLLGANADGLRLISGFLYSFVSSIPLWCGLIALYIVIAFTFTNQVMLGILTFIALYILPSVFLLLRPLSSVFATLHQYHPMTVLQRLVSMVEFNQLYALDWRTLAYGGIMLVISTGAAYAVFRKKDF